MNSPTCSLWGCKPRRSDDVSSAANFAVFAHSQRLRILRGRTHLLDQLLLSLVTDSGRTMSFPERTVDNRRRRKNRRRRAHVERSRSSFQRFSLLGSTVQVSAVDAAAVPYNANISHLAPNLVCSTERT